MTDATSSSSPLSGSIARAPRCLAPSFVLGTVTALVAYAGSNCYLDRTIIQSRFGVFAAEMLLLGVAAWVVVRRRDA